MHFEVKEGTLMKTQAQTLKVRLVLGFFTAMAFTAGSAGPAAAVWSGTVTIEHTYMTGSVEEGSEHSQTVTYTLTGVVAPGGAAGPLRFDEVATWANNYAHSEWGGTCPDSNTLFRSEATSQDAGTGSAVVLFFQQPDGSWLYNIAATPVQPSLPLDTLLRCGQAQPTEPYIVSGLDLTWGTGELEPFPAGETPATVTTLSGSKRIQGVTFCCDHADITWSLQRGIVPTADLQVSKTVRTLTPTRGLPIEYDIVVTNAGPDVASNVSLSDSPGAGLGELQSLTSNGATCSALLRTCAVASLAPGSRFTARAVFATDANAEAAVNDAAVSTSTVDPVPDNNSATVNTPLQDPAALTFVIAVVTGYSLPFSVTSPGGVKGGDIAQVIGEPNTIAQVNRVCITASDWRFTLTGAQLSASLTYGGDPTGTGGTPTAPIGYHALENECGKKITIAGVPACRPGISTTFPLVLAGPLCADGPEAHLVSEFPVTVLDGRLIGISHDVTVQVGMTDGRSFECSLSKKTGGERSFLGGTSQCTHAVVP